MDTAVRSELAPGDLAGGPSRRTGDMPGIEVRWLGRIDYRPAWALQRELVDLRPELVLG